MDYSIHQTCTADFLKNEFSLELSVGSLIFGLPHTKQQKRIMMGSSRLPSLNGSYTLETGTFWSNEKKILSNQCLPISTEKLCFVTEKRDIFYGETNTDSANISESYSGSKSYSYSSSESDSESNSKKNVTTKEVPFEKFNKHGYRIVFGGHLFTNEGWKLKKCYIYYDKKMFSVGGANNIIVPFTKCFVAKKFKKYSDGVYTLELIPLSSFIPFCYDNIPKGCAEINAILSMTKISDFNSVYESFLKENTYEYRRIQCVDSIAIVPEYLRGLFGSNSPLFYDTKNFGQKSHHDINSESLCLLISWLKHLVMKKEIPSYEELVTHEMNIDEWLHICDYCDIPFFTKLFTEIKNVIENT